MFAATVLGLTGVILALFVFWMRSLRFREWIEAPKYEILDQEERFEARRRDISMASDLTHSD